MNELAIKFLIFLALILLAFALLWLTAFQEGPRMKAGKYRKDPER